MKVQNAKSAKGNTISYVSFENPLSVERIVVERKSTSGSSSTWQGKAKAPELGEWTK